MWLELQATQTTPATHTNVQRSSPRVLLVYIMAGCWLAVFGGSLWREGQCYCGPAGGTEAVVGHLVLIIVLFT